MARTRGRSRRGERCWAAIPHGHWKTTTLVAALTTSGIAAPMVLDGAMDGEMFVAYMTHILLKELRLKLRRSAYQKVLLWKWVVHK